MKEVEDWGRALFVRGLLGHSHEYNPKLPEYTPTFEEVSKQMRINQEIIMREITEHVDKEIARLKAAINEKS